MTARDDLAEVIRDGEGTWRTPLEAADAILAAGYGKLADVLAIADGIASDITGADGVENEAQDEIRDQIAGRIRAAVSDALEAGR